MSIRDYPKVWSRFERKVGDGTLKFEIEDIPESLWSIAVEFMLGNYIKEDVWWVTAGKKVKLFIVAYSTKVLTKQLIYSLKNILSKQ